jgi:hypothetical protein
VIEYGLDLLAVFGNEGLLQSGSPFWCQRAPDEVECLEQSPHLSREGLPFNLDHRWGSALADGRHGD